MNLAPISRKKKGIAGLFAIGFLIMPCLASAANLFHVYQQAVYSDPIFKTSQAQYLATRENVAISGAQLLPDIELSGTSKRQLIRQIGSTFNFNSPLGPSTFGQFNGVYYNSSNFYSLNLTQPIFNLVKWRELKNAHAQVKQAEANYLYAAQDLMVRTAQSYFNVLQASDTLQNTIAHKNAVGEELHQISEKYQVGLAANADLEEARANYEGVAANEISARNSLATALDALRVITGEKYDSLMGADKVPLERPHPDDLSQWIRLAEKQNYQLLAAVYGAVAAQENIKIQSAGHWPQLDFIGGYQFDHESRYQGNNTRLQTQTGQAGITMRVPVYQGGGITAKTRQAADQYQQSIAQMELTHRQVVQNTETAYLTILTDINKIQADLEEIRAKEVSLEATKYGYQKGTRTILDVLNVQSTLYQAKIDYSKDLYNYLLNIFLLKEAVGTLQETDVVRINSMLRRNTPIKAQVAKITQNVRGERVPLQTNKTDHKKIFKGKFQQQITHQVQRQKAQLKKVNEKNIIKKRSEEQKKKSEKQLKNIQKKNDVGLPEPKYLLDKDSQKHGSCYEK